VSYISANRANASRNRRGVTPSSATSRLNYPAAVEINAKLRDSDEPLLL